MENILLDLVKERGVVDMIMKMKLQMEIADHIERNKQILFHIKNMNVMDSLRENVFQMGMLGGKGSGRTNLLSNLLHFYENHFDNIFIVSPTFQIDERLRHFNIPNENFFENITDLKNRLMNIYNSERHLYPENKTKNLVIFDEYNYHHRRSGSEDLRRICCNNRHLYTSIIHINNSYRKIDPSIRSCMTNIALFKTYNEMELRKYWEELSCGLSRDNFMNMYRRCVNHPYSFMYIDYEMRKIYKNLNERVYDFDDTVFW